jgi:hypothetical protein
VLARTEDCTRVKENDMSNLGWAIRPEDAATIGMLLLAAFLLWLTLWAGRRWIHSHRVKGDDALTVAAALVAAMFGAQGMWGFLRATLHLPTILAALGFTLFELVMLVCALRARRSLLADGSSGPEGAMLWLFATHAQSWAEALFRLLVPSIAAWLWHRLMRLEHRQLTGKLSGINWRLTPERILIRLGLADPTDRTAAEVSAERTLMTLAIAARKARTPGWGRGRLTRRRLDAALQRATEYARLATDPASQQLLITNLGVLNGADALIALTPPAPWLTATSSAQAEPEATIRRLISAGMLEVNDRTKILFGLSATTPQPLQPGWSPSRLFVVGDSAQQPVEAPPCNQAGNHSTGGTTAGQGADLELSATIRATIQDAAADGLSEREIAKKVGISRDRVRVVLGRPRRGRLGLRQPAPAPQPVLATVNGHQGGSTP